MITAKIADAGGSTDELCIHSEEDNIGGAVVYTRELDKYIPKKKTFVNPDFGEAMNQDATAGGIPVQIHDGLDSVLWTGSSIVGGSISFSSTNRANSGLASVRANSPSVGDIWEFDKGSAQSLTGYVSISMAVNVNRRWTAGDSVSIYGWDSSAGLIVGNKVLLETYINEFDFDVWQQIFIPLSDLGLEDKSITGLRFQQESSAGLTGDFFVDDLQIEQTGSTILFTVAPDQGKDLIVNSVRMLFVNNVIGTAAREYNNVLGVTMASGITINRTSRGIERVGRNISNLYDFYQAGFNKVVLEESATDTILCLEIEFLVPVLLEGVYGDTIALGVNDNLTGFTKMSAIARGKTNA